MWPMTPDPHRRPAPILVPTDLAVAWLTREGVQPAQARQFIYRHSHTGVLTNHGGTKYGKARWDLRQIREIMWPKALDTEHVVR